MSDKKKLLKDIYGFEFPDTFFEFWDFVMSCPPKFIETTLEIKFLGAFKIFDLTFNPENCNLLWESRYYNDPPEFFSLMHGWFDGLHWGYYIDEPNSPDFPVAYYYSNDAFEISVSGNNLFETVRGIIEGHYIEALEVAEDEPELKKEYECDILNLNSLRSKIQKYYTGERAEIGESYLDKYCLKQPRPTVAKTRDGMGIVVPSHLYKSLSAEDKFQIWNYEPTLEEVRQMKYEAMEALEVGYPGTALKLGKDLWTYQEYRTECYDLLDAAYKNLDRDLLRNTLEIAKEWRQCCDLNVSGNES